MYARVILLLDTGKYDQTVIVSKVAEALGVTTQSLEKFKKCFVEEGLKSAIECKQRIIPPRVIRFDGEFEAHLMALACSDAQEGRK